ncbi:SDR family NAD(P)-dependent oxidoreductase [Krasilnikovia sp. MM14-A1004]|uniref:SDR family NAD(P)-dependent oxidoreductase n=1 Tax=Krasilnikovia sp. MM14-A1004 TaxID=3373541 RepID=UPI00399CB148
MTGLFPVSARSPESLAANAERLAHWLENEGATVPLTDVGHTLARRRSHLSERLTVVADGRAQLIDRLRGGDYERGRAAVPDAGAVFVFSGHGSQWTGMGRDLMASEPVFAELVGELDDVVAAECGRALSDLVTTEDLGSAGMALVQPALFATQVGLARMWRHYGIAPAAVIGHSIGEVAAAVVAGALSAADGARVSCRRAALVERRLAGHGAAALVELPTAEVLRRIGRDGVLDLAVHSSTRACVVSGRTDDLARFVAGCEADGITAHEVPGVRFAAHGRQIDAVVDELTAGLAGIEARKPVIPCYGTAVPGVPPSFDAGYWADNLRNPVRFAQAVQAAAADGYRCFIEVSPHPVVVSAVSDTLADSGVTGTAVFGSLRRDQPAPPALLANVGRAHCRGLPVAWEPLHAEGRLAELPTMAWNRKRYRADAPRADDRHPLLGVHIELPDRHVWQATVDLDRLPWLADHRVNGRAVLPGSAMVEIALAATRAAWNVPVAAIEVSGLEFRRLVSLTRPVTLTTTMTLSGGTATVEIAVGAIVHAAATVRRTAHPADDDVSPVTQWNGTGPAYQRLRAAGQEHGPAFAAMTGLAGEWSLVSWPADLHRDGRFTLHPAVLDACLHGIAAVIGGQTAGTVLPVGIASVRARRSLGRDLICRATVTPADDGDTLATVGVYERSGEWIATLDGIRLTHVDDVPPWEDLVYAVEWVDAPQPGGQPGGRPGGRPARVIRVPDGVDGPRLLLDLAQTVREILAAGPPYDRVVVALDAANPEHAALVGLVRTLRHEHPELPLSLADDPDGTTDVASTTEDEVSYRHGVRRAARFRPIGLPARTDSVPVRPDGAYLVTGGTRGLGLRTAQWLAEQGAGTIVLCGRTGPDTTVANALVLTGDITETAERAVALAESRGHRLRGVVHAAGVLDDSLLDDLCADRIQRVWHPKVVGALRVRAALGDRPLDWWVSYSSLASVVGAPGQAAHAAANAWLDAYGARLRGEGVRAVTVNWGRWAQDGSATAKQVAGVAGIPTGTGMAVLAEILARDVARVSVAHLDRAGLAAAYPHIARSDFFCHFHTTARFSVGSLAGLSDPDRRRMVGGQVLARAGAVLGYAPGELPGDRPLVHAGLDSLGAVQIRNAVREDFGVDVSLARLLGGHTAAELADDVLTELGNLPGTPAVSAGPDRARIRAAHMAQRRATRRRV